MANRPVPGKEFGILVVWLAVVDLPAENDVVAEIDFEDAPEFILEDAGIVAEGFGECDPGVESGGPQRLEHVADIVGGIRRSGDALANEGAN